MALAIQHVTDLMAQATEELTEARKMISVLIDEVKTIRAGDEPDSVAVRSGNLEDACRLFFHIDVHYDLLDAARKAIGAQLEFMSREVIPDVMTERGVRNVTLEDVERQFIKSVRTTASMVDKEEALGWLVDNGYSDLITETVNSSTLSSFAKQYLEETQRDLPDCFKVSAMTVTQVRKKG